MQIDLQLFSVLRECLPPGAEKGRTRVTLPEGASLADMIAEVGIDRHLNVAAQEVSTTAGWQVMVSGSYEPEMTRILKDGDRVQILPPMAGG